MLSDLVLISYVYLTTWVWVLISAPFILPRFKNEFFDAGWSLLRVSSWLATGLIVWTLSHMLIPLNTRAGIWILSIIGLCLALRGIHRQRSTLRQIFKDKKPAILVSEALFIFGLFSLSLLRAYNPDINNLEKFMDAGLIISYLHSPTLPIEDMWLVGHTFNYYTFGHFQGAVATHLWGIQPEYSYNLLLGFLLGLGLSMSYSVVTTLIFWLTQEVRNSHKLANIFHFFHFKIHKDSSSWPIIGSGVLGAYLVNLAGNTQPLWYFLKNGGFQRYWYPDATRFIERTIHEFPSYSYIVSDLHAHVWNIVHVLLLLHLSLLWIKVALTKTERHDPQFYLLSVLNGVMFGVMVMTSTWDMLVYGLMFAIMAMLLWTLGRVNLIHLITSGVITLMVMVLVSAFWWLNFESISEGVRIAKEHSPFWQLIALWGVHLSMGVLAVTVFSSRLLRQEKASPTSIFILGAFLTGWLLILLPEFIYFKDIYETQPRANTMFKLTYQAFVVLSVLGGAGIGSLLSLKVFSNKLQTGLQVLFAALIAIPLIYPYYGIRDFYIGTPVYKGLDGLHWMQQTLADDYQGLLWLRQHTNGRPTVLEAVGDSYTTFARISTFSGMPTVLGWRVHEWLWRGSYDLPGARSTEVERMYLNPTSEDTSYLFDQYDVKYIIVGQKEIEAYPNLDRNALLSLGEVVFQEGQMTIIELNQ